MQHHFSKELGDIENMMLADQLDYLPNDILVKSDRASMSQSLETRAPFLDQRVAQLAWSTPTSWRLDSRGGKKILRDLLSNYIPKSLIEIENQ